MEANRVGATLVVAPTICYTILIAQAVQKGEKNLIQLKDGRYVWMYTWKHPTWGQIQVQTTLDHVVITAYPNEPSVRDGTERLSNQMCSKSDDRLRDPRLPSKPLETYTGPFQSIRLGFTPEEPPPLESRHDSFVVHYRLELGYLHIFLDGVDATELVPSAQLYSLLVQLGAGLSDLVAGQAVTAHWLSDPWQMDISSNLKRNQAFITLHVPGKEWVAIRNVSVTLDQFGREVLKVSKQWLKYLDSLYHDEITDPERGQYYRNFERILKEHEQVLREYDYR